MLNTQRDQAGEQDDEWAINITHFVPSVELKGTRSEKLAKLEQLIDHLEGLRRSLNEPPTARRAWNEEQPLQFTRSDHWWAAALLITFVLAAVLGSRACTGETNSLISGQFRAELSRNGPPD